jgi:tRNA(Ile)-lysidine synthetase-like protein
MSLPLSDGDKVTIRSRRPGDRIRPFGCGYSRRLKDVLIDRKMPRHERDQLPLLSVDGKIVWVPGITIDDEARLRDAPQAWVAELEPVQESIE